MKESSSATLKWVVIGGGIAGLTSAYLLKQAGHSVVVLEKSSRDEHTANQDGGVRIPPNMSRLLQELPGAEKLLMERAMKCAGLLFYQCNSDDPAELVGRMDFPEEIMNDLGCDFYFIPHKYLHEHLLNLCTSVGVEIRHGFEVVEILSSEHELNLVGMTVIGKSGAQVTGDIVIGADGKNSITRKILLAEQDEAEEQESFDSDDSETPVLLPIKAYTGATMSIPVSLIRSDPELAPFLQENYWPIFMGNGTSVAMSQYGPDLYLLDLTYGMPPRADDRDEEWLSSGTPVSKVLERVEEYDPRVKKLIRLASTSHWNIQTIYDLPRYVSKLDNLIVIGDAVHSVAINGTYNAAAAFEEAFTLGRLFSKSPPGIAKENASFLLNGYQQIQRQRMPALEKSSMEAVILLGLLPPEREARNNGFRLTLNLKGADDATLEHVWAGYISLFNYDARDAVDEWWMNWSRLGTKDSVAADS
ncbi:FAD/NAD(P)-binding domain-containing protein [Gymnopus androsaceus JB14]|uniref:FAD/NAD(P)-binding domain-containing protein n=1 Tax=Gymnopus androsaceus JB14 TaxID=1447944 RepID=A0A6A4GPX0_9AGAR|nr:FAD/NAD(P)-binding domain-containing protein [Gymnopus androsaceus JB14]